VSSYAILLVTASWMSGSAGETATPHVPTGAVVQCCHRDGCGGGHRGLCRRQSCAPAPCDTPAVDHGCDGCPCKQVLGHCGCRRGLLRRILDRLKNCRLCCRRNRCRDQVVCEQPVCHVVTTEVCPAPAAAPAPATEPQPDKVAPEPKKETPPPPPPPAAFEIKKEYLPKVGNAADYSWVTGQLFYIHAEGGLWLVRYAPHEKEDRYGGSVVLAPSLTMDTYQEGDLVTVRGGVLHDGRASKYLGGPPYRANNMELVERLK
jgi:hypothetical protein